MATITKTYSVMCTCGDKMQVEAESREEAELMMLESLDELALANHAAEKHGMSDDAPTTEEMREIIAATLVED